MVSKIRLLTIAAVGLYTLGYGWRILWQGNHPVKTSGGTANAPSLHTRLIKPPRVYTAEAERNAKEHDEVTAFGLKAEHFTVLTKDNVKLAARYIPPAHASPRASVIVLHGHGSSKESELWCARSLFAPMDCATIFFDMRAHGESAGEYFTFGAHESGDVKAVLDDVQSRHGPLGPIGLFAGSAGASVAICGLSTELRIRCALISSAFISLEEANRNFVMRSELGSLPDSMIRSEIAKAQSLGGFRVRDISLVHRVPAIHIPVLLIYGEADSISPLSGGRTLLEAWGTSDKNLLTVPLAEHGECFAKGGEQLMVSTRLFFRNHLGL